MSNNGDQIVDKSGKSLYFSKRYNEYVSLSVFCSEEFKCNSCLDKNNEIRDGTVRYDSLVLCDVHHEQFKPIMQRLCDVINSIPNKTVITNLGLN